MPSPIPSPTEVKQPTATACSNQQKNAPRREADTTKEIVVGAKSSPTAFDKLRSTSSKKSGNLHQEGAPANNIVAHNIASIGGGERSAAAIAGIKPLDRPSDADDDTCEEEYFLSRCGGTHHTTATAVGAASAASSYTSFLAARAPFSWQRSSSTPATIHTTTKVRSGTSSLPPSVLITVVPSWETPNYADAGLSSRFPNAAKRMGEYLRTPFPVKGGLTAGGLGEKEDRLLPTDFFSAFSSTEGAITPDKLTVKGRASSRSGSASEPLTAQTTGSSSASAPAAALRYAAATVEMNTAIRKALSIDDITTPSDIAALLVLSDGLQPTSLERRRGIGGDKNDGGLVRRSGLCAAARDRQRRLLEALLGVTTEHTCTAAGSAGASTPMRRTRGAAATSVGNNDEEKEGPAAAAVAFVERAEQIVDGIDTLDDVGFAARFLLSRAAHKASSSLRGLKDSFLLFKKASSDTSFASVHRYGEGPDDDDDDVNNASRGGWFESTTPRRRVNSRTSPSTPGASSSSDRNDDRSFFTYAFEHRAAQPHLWRRLHVLRTAAQRHRNAVYLKYVWLFQGKKGPFPAALEGLVFSDGAWRLREAVSSATKINAEVDSGKATATMNSEPAKKTVSPPAGPDSIALAQACDESDRMLAMLDSLNHSGTFGSSLRTLVGAQHPAKGKKATAAEAEGLTLTRFAKSESPSTSKSGGGDFSGHGCNKGRVVTTIPAPTAVAAVSAEFSAQQRAQSMLLRSAAVMEMLHNHHCPEKEKEEEKLRRGEKKKEGLFASLSASAAPTSSSMDWCCLPTLGRGVPRIIRRAAMCDLAVAKAFGSLYGRGLGIGDLRHFHERVWPVRVAEGRGAAGLAPPNPAAGASNPYAAYVASKAAAARPLTTDSGFASPHVDPTSLISAMWGAGGPIPCSAKGDAPSSAAAAAAGMGLNASGSCSATANSLPPSVAGSAPARAVAEYYADEAARQRGQMDVEMMAAEARRNAVLIDTRLRLSGRDVDREAAVEAVRQVRSEASFAVDDEVGEGVVHHKEAKRVSHHDIDDELLGDGSALTATGDNLAPLRRAMSKADSAEEAAERLRMSFAADALRLRQCHMLNDAAQGGVSLRAASWFDDLPVGGHNDAEGQQNPSSLLSAEQMALVDDVRSGRRSVGEKLGRQY